MLYPAELRALNSGTGYCVPGTGHNKHTQSPEPSIQFLLFGRGREIRTPDILLPKQARYQTALYPVIHNLIVQFTRHANLTLSPDFAMLHPGYRYSLSLVPSTSSLYLAGALPDCAIPRFSINYVAIHPRITFPDSALPHPGYILMWLPRHSYLVPSP